MPYDVDAMILALVEKHGFALPGGLRKPGLDKDASGYNCWSLAGQGGLAFFDKGSKAVHDLCVCEFARQLDAEDAGNDTTDDAKFCSEWDEWMGLGDSAAAIRALYEAMEATP